MLTLEQYRMLYELVCSQRNPQYWQAVKDSLRTLASTAPPKPNHSVDTGDRNTFGGGSKQQEPKP